MAPTARLASDERRTRWFRRIAPVAVLLGILILLLIPGMLAERRPEDRTNDASVRPITRITPPIGVTHVAPGIGREQVIGPPRPQGPPTRLMHRG